MGSYKAPGIDGLQPIFFQSQWSTEVIHSMKRKTGKVGWMAIKIDLEKAYDRIKWAFIEDTLLQAGFNVSCTNRIMTCVKSSMMKVL